MAVISTAHVPVKDAAAAVQAGIDAGTREEAGLVVHRDVLCQTDVLGIRVVVDIARYLIQILLTPEDLQHATGHLLVDGIVLDEEDVLMA